MGSPLITHAVRREAHKTIDHGSHRSVLHYTMLSSCQSAPDYLPNIRLGRAGTANADEKGAWVGKQPTQAPQKGL